MRIAIDGTMLARGGGLTGLVNVLESWRDCAIPVECTVYVSRSEVLQELASLPGNHKVVPFALDLGGQKVFLRRQTVLGKQIEQSRAQVILTTNSMVGRTQVPQVVHHQNVLWFLPTNFFAKLRSEGLVPALRYKAWAIAARKALKKSKANIFVSAYLQRLAEQCLPASASRNWVVHNGLSKKALAALDFDSAAVAGPHIAAITSPNPHKENDLLIKTLKQLTVLAPGIDWQLKVAGKGNYNAEKQLASDLGVAERVTWLGFLSEAELDRLLRSSLCLLFPSSIEAFGNPPLEAMARKCPVVACDGTAISEVCGDAAILVPPRDCKQLAAAIDRYRQDEFMRRDKVERGLKRVLDFSWERNAQRIHDVCQRVAEGA
ncbi:MAG: glycosyltransferase [Pirellulaceae bacterium]|nr:glycosyltransferase [Pirellulaceae bacterium]